jgi:tripartite motif-containing protein 2/3
LHACELRTNCDLIEQTIQYLTQKFHKAQAEVDNTFNFYKQLLDERRYEVQNELEQIFNSKHLNLQQYLHKLDDLYSKFDYIINFYERLNQQKGQLSELLLFKKPLETKLNSLLLNSHLNENFNQLNNIDLEFISNFQAIQTSIRNTFGYIKATNIDQSISVSDATPTTSSPTNIRSSSSTTSAASMTSSIAANTSIYKPKPIGPPQSQQSQPNQQQLFINSPVDLVSDNNNNHAKRNLNDNFNDLTFNAWVAAANSFDNQNDISLNPIDLSASRLNMTLQNTSIPHNPLIPARSQLKRIKMIYNCKFGEFGINDGQFTEPSGVAISLNNDIIVADTNSHRIQIFDRDGRFRFKFGECGKRDGQLLYPNRASVIKQTGDIVVTERSPTHQIQIYNQYGQFVRKFGANILQHPRGVCVDSKGRIIVVECKVMRVIIFDQFGNVLHKFNCSKYLEFPNGVCCNDKQEIFISDNRAHCIKVFSYDGLFLRQIGGEGITNYPIGVGINLNGDVLIADNHNNFNLTVFTQEGQLINALESKVKHAQCFDVGLMDDGSIVLASKDYRIYVYRYITQQH